MTRQTNSWLRRIRDNLRRGGSSEHAKGVQWFFKEEVRSHGWYTADLRRFARKTGREIRTKDGFATLVQAADQLFTGDVLEEKAFAVLLLENSAAKLGEREFRLFDKWLDRQQLGGSRCSGVLPDWTHDRRRTQACPARAALGQVEESLAPSRGCRLAHPGGTAADAVPSDRPRLRAPARR